ncbi:hypothetical protein [Parageobacillus thermoglucosidasius]|uniref:hypothetical protein n=1 Tax=Parageobacillus thermoglucosidasius TaxID=1426 RepID=UPI002E1EDE6C|nr:hypothetical protein [Parageobacillus thermoglucosidasius]MED4946523.1 hypothetical protein [Parageobacillus thermoglucosidasius]MED4984084.1 hypothetical protein [Parageobacillus thermoglucosidasius]
MLNKKIVAVLSTTVLPVDGTYSVTTLQGEQKERVLSALKGVPHYIGHPATKEIVESFGAVPAPSKLFEGLQGGEFAVCFSIKQGRSNRKDDGFTSPHQDVTLDDLDVRLIHRLDSDGVEFL